jgi:hypothetical protein
MPAPIATAARSTSQVDVLWYRPGDQAEAAGIGSRASRGMPLAGPSPA